MNATDATPAADETASTNPAGATGSAEAVTEVPPGDAPRHLTRAKRLGQHVRGRRAWLALVLIAGALIAWQWIEIRQRIANTQEAVARRMDEEGAQLRALRDFGKQEREAMLALQSRVLLLEARSIEAKAEQAALEGLYRELTRGRDEWMLSEVEQLLALAVQQLQLAGNLQGALLALGNADARLARSERPRFVALRQAIGRDMQRMRALPIVDVPAISLRIESAVLAVDEMGLAFESRPGSRQGTAGGDKTAESPSARPLWERFWQELWREIRSLIHVERFDKPDPALLSPSNVFFLRENLKLRLLNARWALLARDQATFRGELRQAQQWIERYFDARDHKVGLVIEVLKSLIGSEAVVAMPNLAESLGALRVAKLAAERKGTGE